MRVRPVFRLRTTRGFRTFTHAFASSSRVKAAVSLTAARCGGVRVPIGLPSAAPPYHWSRVDLLPAQSVTLARTEYG